MDKAITSALLIIASVVAAVALINAVLPAMGKSSSALLSANSTASDRVRTSIEVVHVATDTSPGSEDQVIIWVKNVGPNNIVAVNTSDVFLTTPTEVKRVPYGSGSEYWDYELESGTDWTRTSTIKITLHLANGSVVTGVYNIIFTVYNAASSSRDFSV